MFCFHFVAGICLSRNLLYWSFASRAMFIGSAFSPAFLPACSAMLDRSGARSLCGWSSSSTPILLVRLSVSFPMSSSGYSFNTLDYSVGSLLVLSWRWLSQAHPPWAITSAQVLWFICCADDVMWRENTTSRASLLTKAKSAHKPSKLTRIHSRTHPLASKMLTLQY